MLVVTGANGFLGSYLVCALLKKGHEVIAVHRINSDMSEFELISHLQLGDEKQKYFQQLRWEFADITDILSLDEIFTQAEMVFHCAARITFNGDLNKLIQVNSEGTANVVNACLKNGVKKLLYISSTAALGRNNLELPISEETVWTEDENNTLYAESKHLAELEVWRGIQEGLDAVILNPGIILGMGDRRKGSCRLFDNIYHGMKFYTRGVNGFTGVKDVAEIACSLAFSQVKNERFVMVAENLSYHELFKMMAKAFGLKEPGIEIKKSYVPWISWILQVQLWLRPKSSLSPETLRTSVKIHRYDNGKILKLGYRFTPVAEVVRETCNLFSKTLSDKTLL